MALQEEQSSTHSRLLTEDFSSPSCKAESCALKNPSQDFKMNPEKLKNVRNADTHVNHPLVQCILQTYSVFKRYDDQVALEKFQLGVTKLLSEAQKTFADELKQLAETSNDLAAFNSGALDLRKQVKARFLEQTLGLKSVLDETIVTEHLPILDVYLANLVHLYDKGIEMKWNNSYSTEESKGVDDQ